MSGVKIFCFRRATPHLKLGNAYQINDGNGNGPSLETAAAGDPFHLFGARWSLRILGWTILKLTKYAWVWLGEIWWTYSKKNEANFKKDKNITRHVFSKKEFKIYFFRLVYCQETNHVTTTLLQLFVLKNGLNDFFILMIVFVFHKCLQFDKLVCTCQLR